MATQKVDKRKKWFVEFPTFRYTQDVKTLARKADLRVVDAKFQGKETNPSTAPKLTLKKEYQPAEKTDEA